MTTPDTKTIASEARPSSPTKKSSSAKVCVVALGATGKIGFVRKEPVWQMRVTKQVNVV